MFKTLTFYGTLLKTSVKASISKRGAFLIESFLMIANNLIYLSMWWIFFNKFQDIRGWNLTDMITLQTVGVGAYGLMQICFGGVRNLSKTIVSSDLDPFLTQPKNILLHIMGAKSFSKGWGHLLTCVILIILGNLATLETLPLLILSIFSGCCVFTSIHIIGHSLPFWMGSIENLSKKYCDILFLFVLYPSNIYSGLLQIVMFTLIPAGVITYLPVQLIRNFSYLQLFVLLISSLGFSIVAWFVFYSGLKKYESGNRFGIRD